MKLLLPLLVLVAVVHGTSIPVTKYRASMETILKAIGTPACVQTCIKPLIDKIANIWDMKDIKGHAESICQAYDDANTCLEKDAYCDLQKGFKKAASGLRHRCQTQIKLYESHQNCVNPRLDGISQKCDSKCGGRQSLITYAGKNDIQTISKYGGNTLIAAGHVKELCEYDFFL